jgi:DNA-binding NtrC family response regulator
MTATQQLVIVRRNQFATFALLAHAFAEEPGVRLIWDRRVRDRRRAILTSDPEERRQHDRRSDPAKAWDRHDYLLLGVPRKDDARITQSKVIPARARIDDVSAGSGEIERDIESAARSDLPVLLSGADAVSRKSLAHRIHRRSSSGDRPLIVVEGEAFAEIFSALNMGSLPGVAVVSDSRDVPRWGRGGTLLIEEVADLSREQQSDLLLFLDRRAVQRVDVRADGPFAARIICGTGQRLFERVTAKEFGADLFYRLNTIHLTLL